MAEQTAKKKKKLGFFPVLLLIIFLASLGACGYLIYGEINKELSIKDMETDIQEYVTAPTQTVSDGSDGTDENAYTFDWEGLMSQSEYVIGWIQMPGIDRISYPVVQNTEDNQYFLTHDWKGDYQSAGAIFMNRYNTNDFTDMNTIIYGHRMKSGSMFGLLKYYEKQDFLDENPYFYIYTPDGGKRTYEIVCCSKVKDGSDAYLMHFESPSERMAHYNMMINSALTKRDVELDRFDTTIMLSTCDTSGSDYYARVVVLGKLVNIDLNGQPEATDIE